MSTATVSVEATFYSARDSNNIANNINGRNIYISGLYDNGDESISASTSAYDCCVACQNKSGCAASSLNTAAGYWYLLVRNDGTCILGQATFEYSFTDINNVGKIFIFSDGNCGQVQYQV